LIQEGREQHPLLYELAAKMIRTFYGQLAVKQKRFEYHLLDALLVAAKSAPAPLALEKLDLGENQRIYYKMLKGTKKWDLSQALGYPSLLDYVKAEASSDKICLFHAHPDVMAVLFGDKVAARLHAEIHQQDGPLLTQELIERMGSEMHIITLDPEIFTLLELGRPHHEENKKTFIAEDNSHEVSLKRNFYLKG
jgi:hypothetical protein